MKQSVFATFLLCYLTTTAKAQNLSGHVLYPLSLPDGFSNSLLGELVFIGGLGVSSNGQTFADPLTSSNDGEADAVLWKSNGTFVDLDDGSHTSTITGTAGYQQVGAVTVNNFNRAMLWSGSASSAIDLTPKGFSNATAYGTDGSRQVGTADQHAILWNGSATSYVDLAPTHLDGVISSTANAISGNQEVGLIYFNGSTNSHAVVWNGAAYGAVDLNPLGASSSQALGTSGSQQVGAASFASSDNQGHAYLWNGTADSGVDLNPTGSSSSTAYSTNGTEQVGESDEEATRWFGTSQSAQNLQDLLPTSGSWDESKAFSIDTSGNIFGYAIGDYDGDSIFYAVEWSVPEPRSLPILAIASLFLTRRTRKIVVATIQL